VVRALGLFLCAGYVIIGNRWGKPTDYNFVQFLEILLSYLDDNDISNII